MSDASTEVLGRAASTAAFARILADETANVTLRARAAEALGRAGGHDSRAALALALHSGHTRIVRQAASSLGRVGIASDRDLLTVPSRAGTQTRQVFSFAQALISYRLGLGTDLLSPPKRLNRIVTSKSREMTVDPVRSPSMGAAIESTSVAPSRLTAAGALRVTCDGVETVVALARDLRRPGAAERVQHSNAVVGCVLRPSRGTIDLAAHLFLLSQPAGDGSVELFAVRRTGLVSMYGTGFFDHGEFLFDLRSAADQRGPKMLLVGRYIVDPGSLGFSQAYVAGPSVSD